MGVWREGELYYHIVMSKISNKVVALTTLGLWVLILVISIVNGMLYGSPPVDSILPPIVASIIGWISFIVTVYAVFRLYKSGGGSGDLTA